MGTFKKFFITFCLLLVIIFLHLLMGVYLIKESPLQKQRSPRPLQVSVLSVMPPASEKSPTLQTTPSAKNITLPHPARKKKSPLITHHAHKKQQVVLLESLKPQKTKVRKSIIPKKAMPPVLKNSSNQRTPSLPTRIAQKLLPIGTKKPLVSSVMPRPSSVAPVTSLSVPPDLGGNSTKKTSLPTPHSVVAGASLATHSGVSGNPTTKTSSSLPMPRSTQSVTKTKPIRIATMPPSFQATYLHNPAPTYPAIAKRRGQEGKIILRVQVNPNGQAGNVQVSQSSGYPILDEAAVKTVWQWRFIAATQAGQAVTAWVQVPIIFQLK